MTPSKLQPAIYGGLFIGILSALPIVNLANCCCLWVIAGGMLAAYLMQQNHPLPVTAGDGATVGLLAGLIGGALALVLSLAVQLAFGPLMRGFAEGLVRNNSDLPPELRDFMAHRGMLAAGLVLGIVIFCVQLVFATLGGLLGAVVFKKAAPTPFDSQPPMPGGWQPPSSGFGGPGAPPPPPPPVSLP